jgi:hypothetical protein
MSHFLRRSLSGLVEIILQDWLASRAPVAARVAKVKVRAA